MSYTKERDEFLAIATKEGLDVSTCRLLLRYATTLHRLSEAQCNGDFPYNGDRDRPSYSHVNVSTGMTSADLKTEWNKHYVVCPNCEASGVSRYSMRKTESGERVCPDCRTTELVKALLHKASIDYWKSKDLATHEMDGEPRTDYAFEPIFSGDPRGCVLKLKVPSGATNDWGREGICVPSSR